MKQNIIAIGGGDFRRHKTRAIDQEIVRCANKEKPTLLFIPTASDDSEVYTAAIDNHFTQLGCVVDTLLLVKEPFNYEVAERKILSADIIYVGGGNTLKMMRRWRKRGIHTLLERARERGTVLCGASAGSICWFRYGNSDSRKYTNPAADYIKVTGLGFINALHCPHYNSESDRQESLERMMKKIPGMVAIALDDCVALQVVDATYRVIAADEHAHAYKVYWKQGELHKEIIPARMEFQPLMQLLSVI